MLCLSSSHENTNWEMIFTIINRCRLEDVIQPERFFYYKSLISIVVIINVFRLKLSPFSRSLPLTSLRWYFVSKSQPTVTFCYSPKEIKLSCIVSSCREFLSGQTYFPLLIEACGHCKTNKGGRRTGLICHISTLIEPYLFQLYIRRK